MLEHGRFRLLGLVPSDLAPKSVKTTMAGISCMWRSHSIWWAGARADGTGYLGGVETVIGVSERFKQRRLDDNTSVITTNVGAAGEENIGGISDG